MQKWWLLIKELVNKLLGYWVILLKHAIFIIPDNLKLKKENGKKRLL
jgi:hypothetical protein